MAVPTVAVAVAVPTVAVHSSSKHHQPVRAMTAVEEAVPAFAQPMVVEKAFSLPLVSDTYYYGLVWFGLVRL